MNDPLPETNVFDVKLPKPGPRGLILRIAAMVLGVGVVAAAAVVIINRAAAPAVDPLSQVMPANTMLFVSMTTQADQQPNFSVVSNAWQNSKEARQLQSALIVAVNSAGFDWETEIQPWLGDRVGAGLIDLGGFDKPVTSTATGSSLPHYRTPFFVVALQTRDKTKSDKFLASFKQQISKNSPSGYYTVTVHDDTYRNTPLVYQTTESSASGLSAGTAFATVNNVVVVTIGADNLKKVIDAALDGTNLTTSGNFKTTMNALPAQNVGALYMDLNQYLAASQVMMKNFTQAANSLNLATPPANQLQQSEALLQALGGVGFALTYEPGGLRFDVAGQFDPGKLPDQLRNLYPATYTAASNRIFDSLPGSTIFAMNSNVPAGAFKVLFDPSYWSLVFANNPGMTGVDIAQKIADFQKAAGVDLKADLLDLFNGDMAFALMPKTNALNSGTPAHFNFPFDLVGLVDSSDAARAAASLDKIFNAIVAMPDSQGNLQVQPLNRAPYTALLDKKNNILLAYGVVGSRLVIGSSPDTLDTIGGANPSPLSADPTFKEATAPLPADRLNTGYFNLMPFLKMITAASGGKSFTGAEYLSAFKWISVGSQAPANGIQKGSIHIGLQPVKTDAPTQ